MKTGSNLANNIIMLRPTNAADLSFVLAVEQHRDNSIFIRQWSADQHLEALEDPNVGHFIIASVSDEKPLGHVIMVGLEDRDRSMELRRMVVADKGKGIGRQAIRLVKSYVFEQLTFHRLWLDVMLYNKRAFRLYKSEGFRLEGVHREAVRRGNRFVDVRVMSILRDEYYERFYHHRTRLLTDSPGVEELSGVNLR